jgi:nucleoside phosphorylase
MQSKNSNIRFLIIMAMHDEAKPLINAMKLNEQGRINPNYTIEHYSGQTSGHTIDLIVNGRCSVYNVDQIGTQVSTLCAHLGIEKFNPNIVINAGTAGGFNSDNATIGDVYLSYPAINYHDRRINIPDFKEYGIGQYPAYNCSTITKALGLRTGIVTTGNSLDYTEQDMAMIKSYNGVVKDMEAAAIAWVAQQHSIPFLAIKSKTDIVDGEHPTEREFLQNLHIASENLARQAVKVIDWLTKEGI